MCAAAVLSGAAYAGRHLPVLSLNLIMLSLCAVLAVRKCAAIGGRLRPPLWCSVFNNAFLLFFCKSLDIRKPLEHNEKKHDGGKNHGKN